MIAYDVFKNQDGRTRRQQNEAFGEHKLNPEPVEMSLDDHRTMDLFWSVSTFRGTGNGMGGISPLSEAIVSWQQVYRVPLSESEIEFLVELDKVYRNTMMAEQERQTPKDQGGKGKKYYSEMGR